MEEGISAVSSSSLLCRGAKETTVLWPEPAAPLTVASETLVLGVAKDTHKVQDIGRWCFALPEKLHSIFKI